MTTFTKNIYCLLSPKGCCHPRWEERGLILVGCKHDMSGPGFRCLHNKLRDRMASTDQPHTFSVYYFSILKNGWFVDSFLWRLSVKVAGCSWACIASGAGLNRQVGDYIPGVTIWCGQAWLIRCGVLSQTVCYRSLLSKKSICAWRGLPHCARACFVG